MNKLAYVFSIFMILIAAISLVDAADVEHRFYDKDNNPLNQVTGIVLVCQNAECSNVATPKTFEAAYDSGAGNSLLIGYPRTLESQYGYAVFFYKWGHFPVEIQNDFRGDGYILDDNQMLKKENCLVSVKDIAISNFEKDKQAVIVAKEVTNNIIRGQFPYRPSDFNAYYGLNANVAVNVIKDGKLISTESKNLLSLMNAKDELSFNYNVKDYGKYDVEITTAVDDAKCVSSSTDKDVKSVELKMPNQAPVASIKGVGKVQAGQAVSFDASGSSDDKAIAKYEWDFGDGGKGEGVKVEHVYNVEGSYNVQLKVHDAEGLTNIANVNVVVEKQVVPPPPGNQKPIANAGNDFKMVLGNTITLDGSKSYDPEGKQLKYLWGVITNPGEFVLTGEQNVNPAFIPKAEGVYVLGLKVNDGVLESDAVVLRVTVEKSISPLPEPAAEFNVVEESIDVSAVRGSKVVKEITIHNKAAIDISGFTANLKFNRTLEGIVNVNLLQGTAKAKNDTKFNLEISASDDLNVDTYTGIITITRADKKDSLVLNLKVLPDICEPGADNSRLRVTIKDPKKGADFKPGQKMMIEADVKNSAGRDLDVGVEAELWNIKTGNVLASVDGDSKDIDKNEKETFEMELEVPNNDDVNEKDDLVLFVRAFEDGDEDKVCSYESKELDVKREDHDIAITDFLVTPSSLSCTQKQVSFRVGVENIGKRKDDNVQIQISNAELGLGLQEGPFTLKEFDESDNSAVRGLTFTLPQGVQGDTYTILLDVLFNDGKNKNSEVKQLTIQDCRGETELTPSLLGLLEKQQTLSNERVVQPATFFGGLFEESSEMNWVLGLGIVLILVIIIYAAKVLARS